jgi:DNA-binding HxlR family transcriptional regulator
MVETIKRLPITSIDRTLKIISGRWKWLILYHLFDGPCRLSALQRLMPEVTQKVLIQQLRELEEHGVVHREVYKQVPPRVEYTATALGQSLEPILLTLCDWGKQHATLLDEVARQSECTIKPRA